MAEKLTDTLVKDLHAPEGGNRITYDSEVKGFGVRVTAAGAKAFILNYRTRSGRERRFTIGSYPEWKVGPARREAGDLKKRIDVGEDPMAEVGAHRDAKTVADLCERFITDHLSKKRQSTVRSYQALIDREILPALKHKKVAEVEFTDIDNLHRKVSKRAPYTANRMVAVLSKMFSLAIRWKWRTDNPTKGIERNNEEKRERYLSLEEIDRLTGALASVADQQGANIIRLLSLTGARRGEVLSARWEQFDLSEGIWSKPSASTKQKKPHRVPLSAAARLLLSDLRAAAPEHEVYVFPGRWGRGHRQEIKDTWRAICLSAGIVRTVEGNDTKGKKRLFIEPSARIHDLRHSYASILASSGQSLPIIGALLGHTQPATTARYAHLMDDPLRRATESVGAMWAPTGLGFDLTGGRRK